MTFTYVDGIIIGLTLLCCIVGYFKGFLHSIASLFNWLVKLIVSFLLCKPFGLFLSKVTPWDNQISSGLLKRFSGFGDSFNANLVGLNPDQLTDHVGKALQDNNIPRFLRGIFKSIFNITPESLEGKAQITLAEIMSGTLAQIIMIAIAFVVIFILLVIVIAIIKVISKKIKARKTVVTKVDRILGLLVGAAKSFLILCVVFGILYLFRNSELFSGLTTTINKSFIGKHVSDLINIIFTKYFNIKDILIKIIEKI